MKTESEAIQTYHGSYKSYLIGFGLSLILTFAAYFLVAEGLLAGPVLTAAIVALCVVQVCVQLLFFLHLGDESKPYWNFLAFLFMLLVLAIIVIGSLWIMYNLNERMMPLME